MITRIILEDRNAPGGKMMVHIINRCREELLQFLSALGEKDWHGRVIFYDEAFRGGVCAALEGALYDISLEHFAATFTHPVMARYLGLLIDGRNLVGLAKHLHWRLSAPPPFLRGGRFAPPALEQLFSRGDAGGVVALVARLGGRSQTGLPGDVEHGVLEAQRRALRRLGRETEGTGPILDYLWRCGQECRNIGLLARLAPAGGADAGDVDDEIVR